MSIPKPMSNFNEFNVGLCNSFESPVKLLCKIIVYFNKSSILSCKF